MKNTVDEGVRFLLKLYDKGLYDKKAVKHSASSGDDKFKAVQKYLDRLESSGKVFSRDKKGALKYLKNRYYDKYVIKREDVPSSYLERKKRICKERGVVFSKKDEINKVIKWQKSSLDKWLDYLMRDDISYPMWARYWAFQGMVRLGFYDYEKHSFGTRTKKTLAPFPRLDEEALKGAMDSILSYYSGTIVDDEELNKLVKQGNFGKIYSRFLWNNELKVKEENKMVDNGIWKKYNQGSNYKKLQSDIDGKFTFWCIEEESIAFDYLSVGDVYIYYTKDSEGNYTMPRVAVVTEYDEVTEIRGISDASQNVESEFLDVVKDKLKEFKHDKKFDLMLSDMEYLKKIVSKNSEGEELSKEDLRFLYEIDGEINCFGKSKDADILKLKKDRDKKSDYGKIYGCPREMVGICPEDLEKKTYVYVGNIEINSEELSTDFNCPAIVLGNFEAPYLTTSKGLDNLSIVGGNLVISRIEDTKSLNNLKVVSGDLYAGSLNKDDISLESIGGVSHFSNSNDTKKRIR